MHVFLTGATGFIGSYVLRALRAAGHTARCLVRDPSHPLAVEGPGVEKVRGDVARSASLTGLVRGCDAVIHLVGIIEERPSAGITFETIHYEGTKHVVDEALDAGVERFVQMSANGARADGVSSYQSSKWRAEEYVRGAGLKAWTILRPSLVFGAPAPGQEEFVSRLARTLVRPFPVLPVFGEGRYLMQPISVEEVSAAFVQALTLEAARNKTYCVAGPEAIPYRDLLDRISAGLGEEPKPKLNQPVWLVRPVIHSVGRLGLLPITPDQFEMLLEGNACDSAAFYRDFDLTPKPFTGENLAYLRSPAT